MRQILIEQGRVIDPSQGIDRICDVYLKAGVVVGLGQAPDDFNAEQTVDASGCLVIPSLIDLCARLREPGATHKATISSELAAAAACGIGTVCCLPDTQPVIDNPAMIELINQRCELTQGAKLRVIGALTENLQGKSLSQMASLKAAGCVALTQAERPIHDTHVLFSCYQYAENFDIPVIVSPRDPFLGAHGIVHEGEVSLRLGLSGIPTLSETLAIHRHLQLAEETGVRIHFSKLSCANSVKLIARAKQRDLPVSADVSIAHLFLTEMDLLDFNAHALMTPPLRTSYDRDALRQGVIDGVIDAICSDHQPHERDAKQRPLQEAEPGYAAFDTFLPLLLRFAEDHKVALETLLARVTTGPAQIIGQKTGLGVGQIAEVCIIDASKRKVVEPQSFHSAGKHSAFSGWRLPGQVRATWVHGRRVL